MPQFRMDIPENKNQQQILTALQTAIRKNNLWATAELLGIVRGEIDNPKTWAIEIHSTFQSHAVKAKSLLKNILK